MIRILILLGLALLGGGYIWLLSLSTQAEVQVMTVAKISLNEYKVRELLNRLDSCKNTSRYSIRYLRRRLRKIRRRGALLQSAGSADPFSLVGFQMLRFSRLDANNHLYWQVWQQTSYIYGKEGANSVTQYLWAVTMAWIYTGLILSSGLSLILATSARVGAAIMAWLCVFAITVVIGYIPLDEIIEKGRYRRAILHQEFPHAVTKLTLLLGAGLELSRAWQMTAQSSEGLLYAEMKKVTVELDNGVLFTTAYEHFSQGCQIQEIAKLGAVIEQAMRQGQSLLVNQLQEIVREVWLARKHRVKRLAEVANGKLLIPLLLSLIGVMVLVLGPVLLSFN